MLGGGVYRGSTVLVTGSAGTGKSSLAAHAVDRAHPAVSHLGSTYTVYDEIYLMKNYDQQKVRELEVEIAKNAEAVAVARAAATRGTALGLSSFASRPVERVVAVGDVHARLHHGDLVLEAVTRLPYVPVVHLLETTTDIANRLAIAPASVSGMVRRLAEQDRHAFVSLQTPGVKLTMRKGAD